MTKKNQDIFIHETSFVDENVTIGKGTKIWHFNHILKDCEIGNNCSFGQNVVVGPNVNVGNKVKIQNNVSVYEGVTLEDGVFCGPSCVFTNVNNPRSEIVRKHEYRKTLVKRGATLGANCTIVCGITIGKLALHSYEIDHLKQLNLKKTKEKYIKVIEEEPLKNECQHFIEVINQNIKPLTDGLEGMRVLKVLSSIQN